LARELARQQIDVEVITCGPVLPEAGPAAGLDDVVRTHYLPAACRRWPWTGHGNALFRTIKALERPVGRTVLHDTGLWLATNHACAAAARALKLPLVLSPRGMLSPWALKYRGFKKRLAWMTYQRRDLSTVTLMHATSNQEALELAALGFGQPITVIPNGVELPPTHTRSEQRTRCDANGAGERIVLFLSRLHPKKGLMDLIRAWAKLRPVGWRVVIGGGGDESIRAEIQRALRFHGLSEKFTLIGEVHDSGKWELYQSADLFVLPSQSENFGLVIAEALASGVPVVTTRHTPWEDLNEYRCGWWIEPGPDALQNALRQAMALSDTDRHHMGENGRRLIESRYTWPNAATRMRAAYEWLLGSAEKPAFVR